MMDLNLTTSLEINNLPLQEVGRVLETLREAGYQIEINIDVAVGGKPRSGVEVSTVLGVADDRSGGM